MAISGKGKLESPKSMFGINKPQLQEYCKQQESQ